MNDNFETIIDSDGKEHRILKDKARTRVPVMLRDAAGFCMNCMGKGIWTDVNITCPFCRGSGMIAANGEGVDEIVRATSNHTEGARQGEFGADRASLSDADRRVLDYMEHHAKCAPHRPDSGCTIMETGRSTFAYRYYLRTTLPTCSKYVDRTANVVVSPRQSFEAMTKSC